MIKYNAESISNTNLTAKCSNEQKYHRITCMQFSQIIDLMMNEDQTNNIKTINNQLSSNMIKSTNVTVK